MSGRRYAVGSRSGLRGIDVKWALKWLAYLAALAAHKTEKPLKYLKRKMKLTKVK